VSEVDGGEAEVQVQDQDQVSGGPLGVVVEATGNAEVDAAVERLADADGLATAEHVEVYEDVHRGLRDALTALDENGS
jgi:hypothetical protein